MREVLEGTSVRLCVDVPGRWRLWLSSEVIAHYHLDRDRRGEQSPREGFRLFGVPVRGDEVDGSTELHEARV